MQIEIIDVSTPTEEKGPKSSYKKIQVTYKNQDGKVQGKQIVSFAHPEVFDTLVEAEKGQFYEVKAEKNGNFWNWVSATLSDGSDVVENGGKAVAKPNKWVPDEERQRMIVRQNALTNGVAFCTAKGGTALKEENVTKIAEYFYNWVMTKEDPVASVLEMEDDIPQ